MQIEKKHVKRQIVVGHTELGNPVVYIETFGGLHAIFANLNGKIEAISTMPHKAMALWVAQRKVPSIKWDQKGVKQI